MTRNLILNRSSRRYSLNTVANVIHPSAANWSTRVVTNGGTLPSNTTLSAASDFCYALDTAGITSQMITVNVFAPDSLIAAITPLIKNAGNDPWTNNNFVSGDLNIDGLKGNGSNKYLVTGLNPSVVFAGPLSASAGITLYSTYANGDGSGADCVALDGSYNFSLGLWADNVGNTSFDCFTNVTNRLSCESLANSLGYVSGNRTSMTNQSIYQANSAIPHFLAGSNALGPGSAVPNAIILIFCWYSSGYAQFSLKRFSFAAIHRGLSLANSNNLFNAIQTMRKAFGGGWA